MSSARPRAEMQPLVLAVPANEPSNNGTATGPGTPRGAGWMCAATTVPWMFDHFVTKHTVSRFGLTMRIIDANAFGSPQTIGGAQGGVASWLPVNANPTTPVPAAGTGAAG